jgi:4-hydroxy-2-oxoheptanedioate aldolase
LKKNIVKEKLRAGKASVGSWLSLASPLAAEYMATLGFDWLVVDTEHSPIGIETTVQCFQAICTTPTMPFARVAWNDPALIKRLLDGGAMGLVVPMVNSAEQARQAVAAMKFPPLGIRSSGGGRCTVYGSDYFNWANDEVAVILQIEHIEAVKHAREILSVPGVDAGYIGPNDLAVSMGLPPDGFVTHPDHAAAVAEVLKAARQVGVPIGIHTFSVEQANRRVRQGFQFVACGSEAQFMRQAAAAALEQLPRE